MLSSTDLIFLPYTPDLTQAGITYLCRGISNSRTSQKPLLIEDMRLKIGRIASELAFHHFLEERGICFSRSTSTPFTEPDRYDIVLGGRRCELICSPIFDKEQIRKVRQNPGNLLESSARASLSNINTATNSAEDLLIFTLLTGLVTKRPQDLQRAVTASQPVEMLHRLPSHWNSSHRWTSLGKIFLMSEASHRVQIEIGGLGKDRASIKEEFILLPQTRTLAQSDFYSLAYLRMKTTAEARLGLYSSSSKITHIVYPKDWENVWIYGLDIILAGFITLGEYRSKADYLPVNRAPSREFATHIEQLSLPLCSLYPIQHLIQSAKEWQSEQI